MNSWTDGILILEGDEMAAKLINGSTRKIEYVHCHGGCAEDSRGKFNPELGIYECSKCGCVNVWVFMKTEPRKRKKVPRETKKSNIGEVKVRQFSLDETARRRKTRIARKRRS